MDTNGDTSVAKSTVTVENFYSGHSWWASQGIELTAVAVNDMKGTAAKDAMPNLGWDIWETIDDGYPIIKGSTAGEKNDNIVNDYIGEVGAVWSGNIATKFSGGTGTKKDPYIIETAEQLYKMVKEHCVSQDPEPGAYYELTADIYLNDVSNENWYNDSKVNMWYSINLTDRGTGFQGILTLLSRTIIFIFSMNVITPTAVYILKKSNYN